MKIFCMVLFVLAISSFGVLTAEETIDAPAPANVGKVDPSNPAAKITFQTVGNEKIELFSISNDEHDPVLLSIAPSLFTLTDKVTFVKMGRGFGSKEFEIDLEGAPQTYLLKKSSLGELITGIVLTALGGVTCYVATEAGLSFNSFGPTDLGNRVLLYGNLAGGISLLTGIVLMIDAPGSVRRIDE